MENTTNKNNNNNHTNQRQHQHRKHRSNNHLGTGTKSVTDETLIKNNSNNNNSINQDGAVSGGGISGEEKTKKRSSKRCLKQNELMQQQHVQHSKKQQLPLKTPAERSNSNDVESDDGNSSTTTIGSSSTSSQTSSSASTTAESSSTSTSSNATVASDKEKNTANQENNKSPLSIPQQPTSEQPQQQQPRHRTFSEPIDDYNLNVRLRAIAQSAYGYRSDYRASVDPYLLDEVTRNLFHYSSQFHSPVTSPTASHQQSPQSGSSLKNRYTTTNNSNNNMSTDSLTYCPPGSMCSPGPVSIGGHQSFHDRGNYHLFQPPLPSHQWTQQSNHPSSQQQHQSMYHSYNRNNNNNYANIFPSCCRMDVHGSYYNNNNNINSTGIGSGYMYQSYPSPYSYDHHSMLPSSVNNIIGLTCWDSNNPISAEYPLTSNNNNLCSATAGSLLTNNYANHFSYPNIAQTIASQTSYLSQTNLRKIMNNGGKSASSISGNGNYHQSEYLDSQSSPGGSATETTKMDPFYLMNKSTSSSTTTTTGSTTVTTSDEHQQQQQQQVDQQYQQNNNNHHTQNINNKHGKHDGGNDEYNKLQQQQSQQTSPRNVNSKTEKIIQLESVVNILRSQLLNTEELFKKALMSKKTLENTNCDLLSIIDKLKLDLIHLESQQKSLKEQNIKMADELDQLKTRLLERDTEIASLRLTMVKIVRSTGYTLSANELALLRGKTGDYLKNKFKDNYHEMTFSPYSGSNSGNRTNHSNYFYSEPASRRDSSATFGSGGRFSPIAPPRSNRQQQQSPTATAQPTMMVVDQSSPMYTSLPPIINQQPINQMNLSTTPQPSIPRSTSFEDMKMDSGQQISTPIVVSNEKSHSHKSDKKHKKESKHHKLGKHLFSTLPHNTKALKVQPNLDENDENGSNNIPQMSQSLMDGEQMISSNTNKAFSTPNSPMISLKPQQQSTSNHHNQQQSPCFGVTFGKRFCWLRKSKRAASAPELAQDNEIIQPAGGEQYFSPRINLDDTKPKGLRRIFSRKRSTSSMSGISDSFSRGGFRATSGPRLGFSPEKKFQNVNIPFSSWGTTLVADWFAMIGLGMYVNDCKRWCKNGEHLMRATSWEVEKELGIKNSLHRKKLRLAVASMNNEEDDLLKCAGKLDYLWVARWLDDIGLPQYKESFIDARVDGRVLHYLTIDDLLHLKVTSQLHFASIRAAIKVLRIHNYNGQCLKRRATPEEANKTEWDSTEVAVWSSHRIMEWLRSIDLSEFAPNLRGSGVHGALILYENAFNADLFATLLSIPTNKTLLRRHISSKFKQLIGDELSKKKKEYELLPNYQPMIPGAKIKAHKKGHFTLRKKRADFELTDYVCPIGPITSTTPTMPMTKYSALNKLKDSLKKEDSPSSLKSEATTPESPPVIINNDSGSLKSAPPETTTTIKNSNSNDLDSNERTEPIEQENKNDESIEIVKEESSSNVKQDSEDSEDKKATDSIAVESQS